MTAHMPDLDKAAGVIAEPRRIQLKRTKDWRMPENTVKVDRTTRWGNPFRSAPDMPRSRAFEAWCFRDWLYEQLGAIRIGTPEQRDLRRFTQMMSGGGTEALAQRAAEIINALPLIRGKNLACWCPPGEPCHADVLLELANTPKGGDKGDGNG